MVPLLPQADSRGSPATQCLRAAARTSSFTGSYSSRIPIWYCALPKVFRSTNGIRIRFTRPARRATSTIPPPRQARYRVVSDVATMESDAHDELKLQLSGYIKSGQPLVRNVLFDRLCSWLPKDPTVKVQIYNAELAPGGYTNWHRHNGATFFLALEGEFEAEFEEGVLVRAKAG